MAFHPTQIDHYPGTLEDLAKEIGSLRYDALVNFVEYLSQDLESQSKNDGAKGRFKLSIELDLASYHIRKSLPHLRKAWEISEPFMKTDE